MNNAVIIEMTNDYSKLETIYEVSSLKYNQLYNDNETKLYVEGLSKFNPFKKKVADTPVEDSDENSKISDSQIAEKSNIIKRIIDWFKKVFRSIKEKIKKVLQARADRKQMVQVPKEVMNDIKEIKDYYQRTQSAMNQLGTGDVEKAAEYLKNIELPPSIKNSGNTDNSSRTTNTNIPIGNPETSANSNTVINISIADRDKLIEDLDKINSNMEKSIDKSEANTNKTVEQKKRTGLKSVAISILNKVNDALSNLRKVLINTARVVGILASLAVLAYTSSPTARNMMRSAGSTIMGYAKKLDEEPFVPSFMKDNDDNKWDDIL